MPSVQRRRSAGRGGWSVVVLRAGERLGASWSADVSACAVCICGHKSPRRRLCVTQLHVHVCANERSTGDPTGPRTGVRDTILGSTDHATRDGARRRRDRPEKRERRRGIYRRHASARHHDARVARPQLPRRGRSAGSNASPSDETRRRSLVSRMGISSDLYTCMPVAPTSPAGALREIWPRSHLWLARLGLSRWACSCRCAWPTRGCLRP